jgi:hypothetical protein
MNLESKRKRRELKSNRSDLKSDDYRFRRLIDLKKKEIEREKHLLNGLEKLKELKKQIEKQSHYRIELSISEIRSKGKQKSLDSLQRELGRLDKLRKGIMEEIMEIDKKIEKLT